MTVKDFVPPVFIKILKKIRKQEQSMLYKTYNDALKMCHKSYEDEKLCCMVGDKTLSYKATLVQKPHLINTTNVFLMSALMHYTRTFSTNKINVLDFGGACGAIYFEMKRFFHAPEELCWSIIETPEMVKSAERHNLGSQELKFFDSMEAVSHDIDFICCSGSLQYVPNAYEYLSKLIGLNARYIFINRMPFCEGDKEIVTIQTSNLSENGPGKLPEGYTDRSIKYPRIILPYKTFIKLMDKKYKPEWVWEENSGLHNINNIKAIGRGLLFIRKE